MDFLALPRRDLQALCKRNGVRANMTNAAMADALRTLPKVDGIEEYVKQPVPVPGPKEKNAGKQANPLPRGRRAVAESSKPIEPEEDNEDEKGNAKGQSSKEDAQALGVERRGASRRRLVPVVPQLAAMAEEALKREAKRDSAPAPVVGRRGASRRARDSPAVAAPAPESEVAGAEEEQREEKVEEPKREATMDDVPALGVGRRGASRRARPAPSVPAVPSKVVAEEKQRAPIPRGRRVKAMGTSAEPIRLDDSDDEEKDNAKPEQQVEDAQILDVGRRGGAGRRAQAAPAAAAPEAKAQEEQRPPVPRGGRVKAKSTELMRLDESMEDKQEDTKPEEEKGNAPAIAVERRGACRLAPAPPDVPATRRSSAASKAEAGDVAAEAVPIRANRQRKPTLKAEAAAAAAEEKASRRGTRRGAVTSNLLQQEVQEQSQEVVGASDVAEEAVPIRATRPRKPTMKAAAVAATAEEKAPPRATRRGTVTRGVLKPMAQEEQQEAVGEQVSYQQCDSLEELEEAFDTQKGELNKVDIPKPDEDQDFVVTGDEKLMEEIPVEEPCLTDQECMDKLEMQEQLVDVEKCHSPLAHEESPTEQAYEGDEEAIGEPMSYQRRGDLEELSEVSDPQKEELNVVDELKQDKDEMVMQETPAEESSVTDQEQEDPKEVVGVLVSYQRSDALEELAEASVPQKEESNKVDASKHDEDQDVVIIKDEKLMEEATAQEPSLTDQECTDNSKVQEQKVDDEKCHAPLATQEESSILGLVSTETQEESPILDCSSNISEGAGEENDEEVHTAGEETNEKVYTAGEETDLEVNPEDGLGCQEESFDKVLHDSDNAIHLDCSSDISWNELERAANVTNVMPENPVALDEDGDKPNGLVITVEMLQGTAGTGIHDEIHDDQFETVFVQPDQVVTADNLLEHGTGPEITVEENTALIVDARQKSMVTMDEDDVELHSKTEGVRSNEQVEVVASDKVPELELIENVFVQANHVAAAENLPEQVTDCEIIVEKTTSLVVDEKQKSTFTMDIDVVTDHFETVVVHADEQMEVATTDEMAELTETDDEGVKEMKTALIVDEKQQSKFTMNGDIVDDHFKTHVAHADEQKKMVATEVPEVTGTDSEIEKTPLIVDEKNQSTVTMDGDVFFDHFKTDTAHADEQKQVTGTVTEVTGTDEEVVEEKAVVITEDVCAKENHFGIDFGHDNEQMKAITADIELLVSRVQDGDALSERIMTMEPSVCKNSSRKRKNRAEPMAVLEEKGVKVASESEDLTKLSLGQLRAKLKEKLNAKRNKEAKKRVALARVDENICRSRAKGKQLDLNLQQH